MKAIIVQPHQQRTFSRRQKRGHVLLCVSGWFRSFGHLSALRALERVVRRLRTLLTYDFISRSSLTALLIVLRLTLRFCASFDIGWLGSDFNVLFSPARNVLVLFRSLRGSVSTSLNLTFGIKSSNNSINSRFRIASALNNV